MLGQKTPTIPVPCLPCGHGATATARRVPSPVSTTARRVLTESLRVDPAWLVRECAAMTGNGPMPEPPKPCSIEGRVLFSVALGVRVPTSAAGVPSYLARLFSALDAFRGRRGVSHCEFDGWWRRIVQRAGAILWTEVWERLSLLENVRQRGCTPPYLSPDTVELFARALLCEPAWILKTAAEMGKNPARLGVCGYRASFATAAADAVGCVRVPQPGGMPCDAETAREYLADVWRAVSQQERRKGEASQWWDDLAERARCWAYVRRMDLEILLRRQWPAESGRCYLPTC